MATVSVCIPTFNQAEYLESAVRSAWEQTHQPEEILVFDDCSTDTTADVLRALAEEIPTLTVVRQDKNVGIAKNVDACLRAAASEYIVRVDSDDLLMPAYIERLLAGLEAEPDAGYAHAAVQQIDERGRPAAVRRLARGSGYQPPDVALRAAVLGYRVAANILMFRRSALEAAGYIAAPANSAEDYYLSASIADAGFGNTYTDEPLSAYRVWLDKGGVRQRRKLAEIRGLRAVFTDVLEPAFTRRGWGTGGLRRQRATLACRHADSLGTSTYSATEKQELRDALLHLSNRLRVRIAGRLYLDGRGWMVDLAFTIAAAPRNTARRIYLGLLGHITRLRRRRSSPDLQVRE